jgi:hypothetical protein
MHKNFITVEKSACTMHKNFITVEKSACTTHKNFIIIIILSKAVQSVVDLTTVKK